MSKRCGVSLLPVLFTVVLFPTTMMVIALTAPHPPRTHRVLQSSSMPWPVSSFVSTTRPNNLFPIHHHTPDSPSRRRVTTTKCELSTTATHNNNDDNNNMDVDDDIIRVLGGVSEFEQWLGALQDCQYDSSSLRHDAFCNKSLRGLTFEDNNSLGSSSSSNDGGGSTKTKILQIPNSIVLRSPLDDTWDSSLAQQLWKEVQLRQQSKLSGYCALLTNGWRNTNDDDDDDDDDDSSSSSTTYVPPPTAPDAIRHWTSSQQESLNQSRAGRQLLELHQLQQTQWKQKYETIMKQQQPPPQSSSSSPSRKMTWEQFSWAMEVVHSRSFRGTFESVRDSWPKLLPSIGAPVLAAIVGYKFVIEDNPYPNDAALIGLGLVAALPTILNLVSSSSSKDESVVLLPMIDSANHMESADSLIELDPVSNCFTLSVGPNCVVMEQEEEEVDDHDNPKPQLYISYGIKKDSELLLNYGFLPGVVPKLSSSSSPPEENDPTTTDYYRQRLAETFMSRN